MKHIINIDPKEVRALEIWEKYSDLLAEKTGMITGKINLADANKILYSAIEEALERETE